MIKSGIYKITNTKNGKLYIGSSAYINRRGTDHFYKLLKNTHANRHLQAAYNKYGKENFEFEIIQYCDSDKLIEREQFWIDWTRCCDPSVGYNKRKVAESNLGIIASDDARARMSAAQKGIPKSEEHKAKLRKPKLNTENMKGRKLTEEHLAALAASHVGRKVSDEMKAHLSKLNTGKAMSEEAKQKLSTRNKGMVIPAEQRAKMIAGRRLHYASLKKQKENQANA